MREPKRSRLFTTAVFAACGLLIRGALAQEPSTHDVLDEVIVIAQERGADTYPTMGRRHSD